MNKEDRDFSFVDDLINIKTKFTNNKIKLSFGITKPSSSSYTNSLIFEGMSSKVLENIYSEAKTFNANKVYVMFQDGIFHTYFTENSFLKKENKQKLSKLSNGFD